MTERINITEDGRRTFIAEPAWHPRPDGMETAVVFQPGFNSPATADPSRNFGVHGMEITWYLRGPKGAAQFLLFTGWIPGTLSPGHGLPPVGVPTSVRDLFPMGAGVDYHAHVPQYEGQEEYGRDDCAVLGGCCYSDGSALQAEELARRFIEHGEPAIWADLEARYAGLIAPPAGSKQAGDAR